MQRSKKVLGLTLISGVLVAVTAMGQTLQQKEKHAYYEKMVNDTVTDVNKTCESNLTAGFDWTGFDKLTPTDSQGNLGFAPGQFGRECLQGIDSVCRFNGADGKAAIKQKVKKLVVAYGGDGKRSLALAGGTLTYTIDPKVGTNQFCKEWLQQHM